VRFLVPAAAALATTLSVAYSVRFIHDVFFNGEPVNLPRTPHEPPHWMRVPVELLVVLCLLVGLLPLAWLVGLTWLDQLGANPTEFLTRATGDWTLRSLCVVLAVTPLRTVLGWPELARFRRMLGLLTYLYAVLHLACYALFDMGLDLADILTDIPKRPFILVGFAAWLLLSAMALTSFNRVIRAMGAQAARRYFTTAERLSAAQAHAMGLVHELCEPEALDAKVAEIVATLVANGPAAVKACKQLVRDVAGQDITEALRAETARRIADIRASDEGREGVQAFLNKREPAWR
jgi:DMSO/TMAO reductase YedYZ heme-binding membrane subunit